MAEWYEMNKDGNGSNSSPIVNYARPRPPTTPSPAPIQSIPHSRRPSGPRTPGHRVDLLPEQQPSPPPQSISSITPPNEPPLYVHGWFNPTNPRPSEDGNNRMTNWASTQPRYTNEKASFASTNYGGGGDGGNGYGYGYGGNNGYGGHDYDDHERRVSNSVERVRIVHANLDEEKFENVELTLHRGLQARQISMIALGGAIGIGLIIGSGKALQQGGPLGLLLGYAFVGLVCYCMMISLGELSAYLPHKKGFAGYATRFWHPAFGFAMGWSYLIVWLILCPNQINAAGIVIGWWTDRIPLAAWMFVFIIAIIAVNLLGIRVFGELEFWLSSIKVLTLIGLIIFGIIVDLGGNPQGERIGFRYWRAPNGPMGEYLTKFVHDIDTAKFLGFWSVMVNALYAYLGIELIGVTVGEAENPRRNVPIAIRRTFIRIIFLYVGGVFVIGLIVPRNAPVFTGGFQTEKGATGIAASPFVVAANELGIRSLVHIINASLLIFIFSAANSELYISSRTLYGLALQNQAPKIFKKVNRRGVPVPALAFCSCFTCLVFLNAAKGTGKVFGYFVSVTTSFGAITWMCILYTHICFMRGLRAQGVSRSSLPYVAPFQPYAAWFGIVATAIITIFKGFDAFIPFKADEFITAYIGVPVFALLFAFWKWRYEHSTISPEKMDLISGKKEIDDEEEKFLAMLNMKGPRTLWRRIWDAL